MTPHNTLNVNCLICNLMVIKNGTEVTLNISSNVVGDSNDENNFPHKLLLINAQFLRFREAFPNNSSADIKLSKTQLHKTG